MNESDEQTRTAPPVADGQATLTSPGVAGTDNESTRLRSDAPTNLFESQVTSVLPVVPGYSVSRELARGGMGVVYAAHDPAFEREVAVKVMHPGQDADRFVVESKVTAQLPHPGIPPVYEIGTLSDGRPFLAMKLIEGRTLSAELKAADRASDLPRLLGMFEHICQTVGFAHSKGIVHRDLKPANVMVGAFGEVLVMDWGLAKSGVRSQETGASEDTERLAANQSRASETDVTQAGQVKGTPSYMAPEQARGEPVDARADVFALGAILAVILTGKPPFTGETVHDTLRKARKAELGEHFGRLDECGADRELVAVAKRCLAADAGDRFASGKEVAGAISAYRAGVEDRLRRAERDRAVHEAEAREQRKRRKVQLALFACFVLLLAAAFGFAWYSDRQAEIAKQKQQEENARRERNRDAAVALLEQAEAALRAGDAERAGEALVLADRQFKEGGADDLRPWFDQVRAEFTTLRELDAVAATRWTATDQMKLATWKELAPRLARAFANYGITPGVTPPADDARRIAGSHIREALLAYLEIWAATGDRDPAVREILSRVDPDAFRDAVRKENYSSAALARGFRGESVPEPPVWFAIGQGQDLRLPVPAREQILLAGLRERPNSVLILLTLANLGDYADKDAPARRAGFCRAALAVQPRSVVAWNNLGVALKTLGDLSGAVKAYEKAIEIDPEIAAVYSNLANALRARGDLPGALKATDRALEKNSNYAQAHANRGATLGEMNRWPEALAAHDRAIALDADFANAHFSRGIALSALKDPSGAIAAYRRAIKIDAKFAAAYKNMGVVLRSTGQLDEAEEAYKKAMELGDNGPGVRTNLGGVYYDRKNYPEAIKWAKEAIKKDPNYADAFVILGAAYLLLPDRWEARAAFKRAGQLDEQWKLLIVNAPPPPGAPWPREVVPNRMEEFCGAGRWPAEALAGQRPAPQKQSARFCMNR